jgi:hypothetical protein
MTRFIPAGYLHVRSAVARWAELAGEPFLLFPPLHRDFPASDQAVIRRRWEAASSPLQQELYAGRLRAVELTGIGTLAPVPEFWWGSEEADVTLNGAPSDPSWSGAAPRTVLVRVAELERRAQIASGTLITWDATAEGVTFEDAAGMLCRELEARSLPEGLQGDASAYFEQNPSRRPDPKLAAEAARGFGAAWQVGRPGRDGARPVATHCRGPLEAPRDEVDPASGILGEQRARLRREEVTAWIAEAATAAAHTALGTGEHSSGEPAPPPAGARPSTGDSAPSAWAEAAGRVAGWLAVSGGRHTAQSELELRLQQQAEALGRDMSEATARRLAGAMLKGFLDEVD